MNEYQSKTTNAKIQTAKKLKELKKASGQLSTKQHKELLASISSLQANISSLEASLSANGTSYTESQKDLVQNFSTLQEILQSGLNVNNLKDIKQAKEIIVSNLKDIPKPVVNTTKTEIPKWLASDKSVQTLNDNVIKVVQALIDLEANIKPSQSADEFVPFRRVIRQGNRLVFDDSDWASRSGGGGSGGGGSTGGLTDGELRASPVPVSMSSDIEIGAVELKNGTDDTRAEVTSGNALKVDGSGATQPVSNAALTELGDAINGNQVDVDIKASDLDLMLGTDFSAVFGVNTLLTTTQADSRANTTDGFTVNAWGQYFNGTTWDRMRGDATDGMLVNLGSNNDITGTVTANLSATDNAVLDNIDANTAPTTGLNTGRKVVTTAGTAVAIASSTTCKWVQITAETDNTDLIVVGDSGVVASLSTREGTPLDAGDTLTIPIDNLADVYIDSLVNGEGVTFLYGT